MSLSHQCSDDQQKHKYLYQQQKHKNSFHIEPQQVQRMCTEAYLEGQLYELRKQELIDCSPLPRKDREPLSYNFLPMRPRHLAPLFSITTANVTSLDPNFLLLCDIAGVVAIQEHHITVDKRNALVDVHPPIVQSPRSLFYQRNHSFRSRR